MQLKSRGEAAEEHVGSFPQQIVNVGFNVLFLRERTCRGGQQQRVYGGAWMVRCFPLLVSGLGQQPGRVSACPPLQLERHQIHPQALRVRFDLHDAFRSRRLPCFPSRCSITLHAPQQPQRVAPSFIYDGILRVEALRQLALGTRNPFDVARVLVQFVSRLHLNHPNAGATNAMRTFCRLDGKVRRSFVGHGGVVVEVLNTFLARGDGVHFDS